MWSIEYYKKRLSLTDQKVYDQIYAQWVQFRRIITIRRHCGVQHDYSSIISAINLDHPEIFWVDCFSAIQITTEQLNPFIPTIGYQDTLQFNMFFSSIEEIKRLQLELSLWQRNALNSISMDRNDRNKLWILLDFISRGVKYRECGYAQSHTILGCFHKNHHEVVCQGIAMGMKFLSETFRIPCIVVCGDYYSPYDSDHGPHAWNIFSIGNQFRHLDATVEMQFAQQLGNAREKDVAMTDEEARNAGYRWDSRSVPICIRQ